MNTIATVLGLLLVTTPVPVQVWDTNGLRAQDANSFSLGCRVQVHLAISAQDATRARWTLTVQRVDGLLSAVTVTRSFGGPVLWSGAQAYWTTGLVTARAPGRVAVHATDSAGCVTDTLVELTTP